MNLERMTREQLVSLVLRQTKFIGALRKAANEALAHSTHIASNYAKDVPDDVLRAWAKAQVVATGVLTSPAPVEFVD